MYKVEIVESRFAGECVESAVAIDEFARWPLVAPHWIYLHDDVSFAATSSRLPQSPSRLRLTPHCRRSSGR